MWLVLNRLLYSVLTLYLYSNYTCMNNNIVHTFLSIECCYNRT
jgi:hypothetical protein